MNVFTLRSGRLMRPVFTGSFGRAAGFSTIASRRRILPSAAHLLAVHGFEASKDIPASGPKGHITKGDVIQYLAESRRAGQGERKTMRPTRSKPQGSGGGSTPEGGSAAKGDQFDAISLSKSARDTASLFSYDHMPLASCQHAGLEHLALCRRALTILRESVESSGIGVHAWLVKAAGVALAEQGLGNGTVAFAQQTNGELRKSAVDAVADKPLEEIEALLRSDAPPSAQAAINVFEHEALAATEIIPDERNGMSVAVGSEHSVVGIVGNTPGVTTMRNVSLTFDAAVTDPTEAAAVLERFKELAGEPGRLLL